MCSFATTRAWLRAAALLTSLLAGCANVAGPEHAALSQRAGDPAADLRIADSALAGGNVDLATSLYAKVLAAHPASSEAQLGLGNAAYQAGDLERARVLYAQAAAQAPAPFGAQLGLARVALRQRRLDEAAERYRALLAAQPANPLVAEGYGAVLDLQGHHRDAQAVYRGALRLHPDVQGLRVNLGLSLVLSDEPREGVNVLLDVADLSDAPWQARPDLAFAYAVLGHEDAAKKVLLLDLPPSAADDNLSLYRIVRARLAAHAAAAGPAARALPGASAEAAAVQPANSLPKPEAAK
jgi:Flp pilus assembly protein TadD